MIPTIGVVIPVGGQHGKYIERALQAIANSTRKPDRIAVVVDHTSIPDLSNYDCEVYHVPECRKGASAARNVGVRAIDTEYVYLHDADDLVYPDTLHMIESAIIVTGADFLHPLTNTWVRTGKWTDEIKYDSIESMRRIVTTRDMMRRPNFGICYCVKRDRALEIGAFDESMLFAEDNDFAIRFMLSDRINAVDLAGPWMIIHNDTSTRYEQPPATVEDDREFKQRLESGYYLSFLAADEALHAEAVG